MKKEEIILPLIGIAIVLFSACFVALLFIGSIKDRRKEINRSKFYKGE